MARQGSTVVVLQVRPPTSCELRLIRESPLLFIFAERERV